MIDISGTVANRIGIAKEPDLYDDYDFDEMNPKIEKMFMEESIQTSQEVTMLFEQRDSKENLKDLAML